MKRILLTLMKMGIVTAILYYLIQSGRLNFERLLLLMDSPGILMMMYLIPVSYTHLTLPTNSRV